MDNGQLHPTCILQFYPLPMKSDCLEYSAVICLLSQFFIQELIVRRDRCCVENIVPPLSSRLLFPKSHKSSVSDVTIQGEDYQISTIAVLLIFAPYDR